MTTDKDELTQPAVGLPLDVRVRPHRVPTRAEVERLMKRCQIGVGGRHALDDAHSIMAACYGTLGLLMMCVEWFQARATCNCGDEFTAHDPGTCGACCASLQWVQHGA